MFEIYHNFFDANECNQLSKDILSLREHFIPRSPSLSYFGGNFFDHLSKNDYNAEAAIPGYELVKDKEIYQLSDTDLVNAFKKLDATDLQKTKAILEVENPDALKRVQKSLYEEFVSGARNTLPDNTTGVDLQKLVNKFNTLNPQEKDTLAFALGTNAKEFESRMGDAQKFFNYAMKSGAVLPDGSINPALASEAAFAAQFQDHDHAYPESDLRAPYQQYLKNESDTHR